MRKLTAMVLAGVMSASALAPTALADGNKDKGHDKRPRYELDFKDWDSDFWANESLARLITRGVIKGNGDATIASSRPVNRLEAAIMLSRLLELEPPQIPYGEFQIKTEWGEIKIENKKNDFEIKIKTRDGEFKFEDGKDVPDWGRDAILIGLREGFLIFDGAKLSPMKPLNRLEAAIMMVKAAGLDAEAQARAGADLEFKDEKKIPERLRGYIALAVESGFVTGYEDGTFRPEQTLTRAEWAALLDRLDRRHGPPVTADGRQIKATVTDVHVGSSPAVSVITPVYPGGVTYRVDDTAVFYKGGKEITIADIRADDQVIINLDGEREIILLTVTNAVRQVNGKVEEFVSPTRTATGSVRLNENGVSKTYTVTNDTKVLLAGRQATFADVREGDHVTLKVEGIRVTEMAIKVEAATVTGTLEDVDFGSDTALPKLKIKTADGDETYRVADHATIKAANGTGITLADLNVGDQLTLKVERDLITAIQVKAPSVRTVNGRVEDFVRPTQNVAGQITVNENGTANTYAVTSATQVQLAGKAATFADVRDGDQVTLKLEGSRVTQIAIKVETATVTGALEAVDFGSNTALPELEIKTASGKVTYRVADHATIKAANGDAITLADLNPGDQLTVKVERNLITSIQVKAPAIETVSGVVESFVSPAGNVAGQITVDEDGTSNTYAVTSATQVLLAGQAASFADVRSGDKVTLKVEGTRVTQIAIKVETANVTATLKEIDFGSDSTLPTLTVMESNNVETTYTVADHATVKAANGAAITLEDLYQGDQLTLRVERNLVTAIQVKAPATRTVSGLVEAFVSPAGTVAGQITVDENGTDNTYAVTSATQVLLAGKAATFADVRSGDKVTLRIEGARVTQIAIKVETATVTGTLEAVSLGNDSTLPTLTLKGSNDDHTAYSVAANATVKAANGDAITLEDLELGDRLTLKVERNLVTAIQVRQ